MLHSNISVWFLIAQYPRVISQPWHAQIYLTYAFSFLCFLSIYGHSLKALHLFQSLPCFLYFYICFSASGWTLVDLPFEGFVLWSVPLWLSGMPAPFQISRGMCCVGTWEFNPEVQWTAAEEKVWSVPSGEFTTPDSICHWEPTAQGQLNFQVCLPLLLIPKMT